MNILLKFTVQLFIVILFHFILLQFNGNKLRDGHKNDKKRPQKRFVQELQRLTNVFYLHFNKNFITLDLKMQTFEAERISC